VLAVTLDDESGNKTKNCQKNNSSDTDCNQDRILSRIVVIRGTNAEVGVMSELTIEVRVDEIDLL